jgi:hypothetical protein
MKSASSPKLLTFGVCVTALIAVLDLSGCSSARRALGFEKMPPDEFAVISNAPLAQPPDYFLRPPQPGAPRPQQGTATEQAEEALVAGYGTNAKGVAPSSGEQFLLAKTGATQADPNIRGKVLEETQGLVPTSHSFADRLIFWRDSTPPEEGLDSYKEGKRVDTGAPASGDVPIIERHSKGWFDWLF